VDIDHARSKSERPGTNGTVARFHTTALNAFQTVAFRKALCRDIAERRADHDAWITTDNEARAHRGRWCFGKTPMRTVLDAKSMAKATMRAA